MATKKRTSTGPIYVLKGKVFKSVKVDIPLRIRKNIPWVVTTDTKVSEMSKRLQETPLGTLFVVDQDATLLGVITNSPEAASAKCGGGGGGGGNPPNPEGSRKNCQADCDAACAQRGGCAWIVFDPFGGSTKCTWNCQDSFSDQQDQTVGGLWF